MYHQWLVFSCAVRKIDRLVLLRRHVTLLTKVVHVVFLRDVFLNLFSFWYLYITCTFINDSPDVVAQIIEIIYDRMQRHFDYFNWITRKWILHHLRNSALRFKLERIVQLFEKSETNHHFYRREKNSLCHWHILYRW